MNFRAFVIINALIVLNIVPIFAQVDISGKWNGPISFAKDGITLFRGAVKIHLTQKNNQIFGTCDLTTDQNGSVSYPFQGTMKGNQITFEEAEGDKKPASGILALKSFSGIFLQQRTSKVNEKKFPGKHEIKGVFSFADKNLPEISVFLFSDTHQAEEKEITINPTAVFLMNNLRFDKNQFDILPNNELDKLLDFLKNNPKYAVHIEGHTDEDGGEDFNIALSLKRANSVKKYLIKNGIAPEFISTAGLGGKKPISEKKELNRRVEVSFKKK